MNVISYCIYLITDWMVFVYLINYMTCDSELWSLFTFVFGTIVLSYECIK